LGVKLQDIEAKLQQILTAWRNHAPQTSFGAMTLEEFQSIVQASFDARARIKKLQEELRTEQNRRDDADKASLSKAQQVVNSVIGDINFGPDSDLYEAMGYVRKSERKTGLTRKQKQQPAP
jgi:hypothetical protein